MLKLQSRAREQEMSDKPVYKTKKISVTMTEQEYIEFRKMAFELYTDMAPLAASFIRKEVEKYLKKKG